MKQIVVMMAAALTCVAFAQGLAHPVPKGHMGVAPGTVEPIVRLMQNPEMAAMFGITAEQVAKLKAMPDSRKEIKALQAKIKAGQDRQADLLKADPIDENAVMAALDEVWAAKKEIARLQTKRVIAVRSILTPEQVRKALECVKTSRRHVAPQQPPRAKGGVEKKACKSKGGS